VTDEEMLAYGDMYPETKERIRAVLDGGDPEQRALLEQAIAEHKAENSPPS